MQLCWLLMTPLLGSLMGHSQGVMGATIVTVRGTWPCSRAQFLICCKLPMPMVRSPALTSGCLPMTQWSEAAAARPHRQRP